MNDVAPNQQHPDHSPVQWPTCTVAGVTYTARISFYAKKQIKANANAEDIGVQPAPPAIKDEGTGEWRKPVAGATLNSWVAGPEVIPEPDGETWINYGRAISEFRDKVTESNLRMAAFLLGTYDNNGQWKPIGLTPDQMEVVVQDHEVPAVSAAVWEAWTLSKGLQEKELARLATLKSSGAKETIQ